MRRLILFLFICIFALPIAYANNTLTFSIKGISGDLLTNVQSRLNVIKEAYKGELATTDIKTIYNQSKEEIRKALEPYGYFNPEVKSNLEHNGEAWIAKYNIDTGRAVKISRIEIKIEGSGKDNKAIQTLIKNSPIKKGDVLQTNVYEKIKEQFFITADEEGYIKAFIVDNKILINRETNQAEIILHFNTGPQYYFGPIVFEEEHYSEEFLSRFHTIKEGKTFSTKKLLQVQQKLANSFYFQQVLITPDFDHVDHYHVPIKISAQVPRSQKYVLGVGYGTYTGPRFTAGMNLKRITETGHHFDAKLKLSQVVSGVAGKYYIPGNNPLTDEWTLGASYQRFMPENGKSNSGTISGGFMKNFGKIQSNTTLNYLVERYEVENQPAKTSELLYPSINLTYTHADDLINPRFGEYINLVLQGATENILSSTSFLQAHLKSKYIFSPTDYSRFILRGELGYTLVKDLNALPLSMRFFAGGLGTIRGYKESEFGPGRYLEVGSIEYQNKIYGNWSAAIFYDLGAATNQFNKHFNNGKGVGIIYNSVIGPVKLYLAKGRDYGVEFSIGPEF